MGIIHTSFVVTYQKTTCQEQEKDHASTFTWITFFIYSEVMVCISIVLTIIHIGRIKSNNQGTFLEIPSKNFHIFRA